MDAQTCLKKLQYVGALNFATVDKYGKPQIRNISAIHYGQQSMYFFTARGKVFCEELLSDGNVQILGYTKYKEMIRLSAKVEKYPMMSRKNGLISSLKNSLIYQMFIRNIQGKSALCSVSKMQKLNI